MADVTHSSAQRGSPRARPLPGGATALICLGLASIALALRLYRLDAQSLWLDEGSSWELSRAGWGALLVELGNPNAAYPLYHLILKGWTALFGASEAALRMPSALAGALAVPMIYLAALELVAHHTDHGENGFLGRARPSRTLPPGSRPEYRGEIPAPHPARASLPPGSRPEYRGETPAPHPARASLPPDSRPEYRGETPAPRVSWYGLASALIVLCAPYTIWYSQEAKVYSLLLLSSALLIWGLARALRTMAPRDWVVVAIIALVGLFVHRLTALLLAAGAWALAVRLITRAAREQRQWAYMALPALLSLALVGAMVGGLGGEQAAGRSAAGAAIPAGPGLALGLTLVRFSLDRWPGDAPWWWLLPWLALASWGLATALRDLWRPETRPQAALLLTLLGLPVALFLAQLLSTRLYEARYLTVVYPAWALLLGYPLRRAAPVAVSETVEPRLPSRSAPQWAATLRFALSYRRARGGGSTLWSYSTLLAAALATSGLALFQPTFGLFSGDPVKEQYREAIAELAARVHPDDAVVLHPAYLRPLYDYYMGRLSADPAPEPLVFFNFWQGETSYGQREWDIERRAKLAGYTRSFLLIAPDHARTVDRPNQAAGDEYGLVGNFWRFSREQATWPCGIWRYNGAHLLCQEAPEAYYTGEVQAPQTPVGATFGEQLTLLGYTLKATTDQGPGVYRAGGNLPISLFWDVTEPLETDYSLFLHLCQACDQPPAASEDGPPLEGYLPTSTWLPGKPARDDRAVALPPDLPPGRYTLLLGLYDPAAYRPGAPAEAGRLRVTGGETIGGDRLVLGTVEIVPADAAPPALGAGRP